ncbi:MAG: endonuclease/exonuclease/phosphatase family protein [Jatrophihabitans sp.]
MISRSRTPHWAAFATAVTVFLVQPTLAASQITSAEAARPSAHYNTWQWNVAGDQLHRGSTTTNMISDAVGSIAGDRNIDFAAFQELCSNQYHEITSDLASVGWPTGTSYARFGGESSDAPGCGSGTTFGVGIFSKAQLGTADYWGLPTSGTYNGHWLVCAPLVAKPHVRFCGVHITAGSEAASQISFVLSKIENYRADGDTVIISGDFNTQPNASRLSTFGSKYTELDSQDSSCSGYGEWSSTGTEISTSCATSSTCSASDRGGCAKIDLTFVRTDELSSATAFSADALSIPINCPEAPATTQYVAGSCSDHRVVTGDVSVFTAP